MKLEINIYNKKIILTSLAIGIYASFCTSLQITKTNPAKILEKIGDDGILKNLYANLAVSLSGQEGRTLFFGTVALLVFLLYLTALSEDFCFREWGICVGMALLFGFCRWTGAVFSHSETWDAYTADAYLVFKDFLYITGWSAVMLGLLLVLIRIIRTDRSVENDTGRSCSYPYDGAGIKTRRSMRTVFLLSLFVLILCWLPYYIIFWPGSLHGDVPGQILQYYHYPVSFQNRWITDGVSVLYSNDHPFILTIIIGKMLDLGTYLGDEEIGIGVLTGMQMIFTAMGCAFMTATLYHFCEKSSLAKAILAVYAVVPIFPMYAQLIGGDSMLALVFLWFMNAQIWLYGTNGEILHSKWFLLSEFLLVFLMGAVKNQGIYIAIICTVCVFFMFHVCWKQILFCMVMPVILFFTAYEGALFSACHVGQVGNQEALSFFFQQTARYVKYEGDEVTTEEKEVIDRILDYDCLAEKYDPGLSDPVKMTYREEATKEDLLAYFKVWACMGVKHPKIYLQAFLSNTWMYYTPAYYKGASYYYYKMSTMEHYLQSHKSIIPYIPEDLVTRMSFHVSETQMEVRELAVSVISLATGIPVINAMIIPGILAWLMLSGFTVFWAEKDYRMTALFLPVFLVFCVCLLSPKNGNVRYLLPAYSIVPAMWCMVFGLRTHSE